VKSPAGSGKVHITVTTPYGAIHTSASNGASAFKYISTEAPEFGRCVKVAKGTGKFSNGACTTEKAESSFEWFPGVSSAHFTLGGEAGLIETVGKTKVTCAAASGAGSYKGTKELSGVTIAFSGCESGGQKCTTSGAAEGEIQTSSLEGELGWKNREGQSVALDLAGEAAPFAQFTCGTTAVIVRGSVIVPVKSNKMQLSTSLKYEATKGKQKPEEFQELPKDVLEASFGGATFEQTGLTVTLTQTNEEEVEVNAAI
jgi:hypothetical protein